MKMTYGTMIVSQPFIIVFGGWYTAVYAGVTTTGMANGWGISVSVAGMVGCLHITIHAMINFIYKVRVNAIKKVGVDGATLGSKSATTSSASSESPEQSPR